MPGRYEGTFDGGSTLIIPEARRQEAVTTINSDGDVSVHLDKYVKSLFCPPQNPGDQSVQDTLEDVFTRLSINREVSDDAEDTTRRSTVYSLRRANDHQMEVSDHLEEQRELSALQSELDKQRSHQLKLRRDNLISPDPFNAVTALVSRLPAAVDRIRWVRNLRERIEKVADANESLSIVKEEIEKLRADNRVLESKYGSEEELLGETSSLERDMYKDEDQLDRLEVHTRLDREDIPRDIIEDLTFKIEEEVEKKQGELESQIDLNDEEIQEVLNEVDEVEKCEIEKRVRSFVSAANARGVRDRVLEGFYSKAGFELDLPREDNVITAFFESELVGGEDIGPKRSEDIVKNSTKIIKLFIDQGKADAKGVYSCFDEYFDSSIIYNINIRDKAWIKELFTRDIRSISNFLEYSKVLGYQSRTERTIDLLHQYHLDYIDDVRDSPNFETSMRSLFGYHVNDFPIDELSYMNEQFGDDDSVYSITLREAFPDTESLFVTVEEKSLDAMAWLRQNFTCEHSSKTVEVTGDCLNEDSVFRSKFISMLSEATYNDKENAYILATGYKLKVPDTMHAYLEVMRHAYRADPSLCKNKILNDYLSKNASSINYTNGVIDIDSTLLTSCQDARVLMLLNKLKVGLGEIDGVTFDQNNELEKYYTAEDDVITKVASSMNEVSTDDSESINIAQIKSLASKIKLENGVVSVTDVTFYTELQSLPEFQKLRFLAYRILPPDQNAEFRFIATEWGEFINSEESLKKHIIAKLLGVHEHDSELSTEYVGNIIKSGYTFKFIHNNEDGRSRLVVDDELLNIKRSEVENIILQDYILGNILQGVNTGLLVSESALLTRYANFIKYIDEAGVPSMRENHRIRSRPDNINRLMREDFVHLEVLNNYERFFDTDGKVKLDQWISLLRGDEELSDERLEKLTLVVDQLVGMDIISQPYSTEISMFLNLNSIQGTHNLRLSLIRSYLRGDASDMNNAKVLHLNEDTISLNISSEADWSRERVSAHELLNQQLLLESKGFAVSINFEDRKTKSNFLATRVLYKSLKSFDIGRQYDAKDIRYLYDLIEKGVISYKISTDSVISFSIGLQEGVTLICQRSSLFDSLVKYNNSGIGDGKLNVDLPEVLLSEDNREALYKLYSYGNYRYGEEILTTEDGSESIVLRTEALLSYIKDLRQRNLQNESSDYIRGKLNELANIGISYEDEGLRNVVNFASVLQQISENESENQYLVNFINRIDNEEIIELIEQNVKVTEQDGKHRIEIAENFFITLLQERFGDYNTYNGGINDKTIALTSLLRLWYNYKENDSYELVINGSNTEYLSKLGCLMIPEFDTYRSSAFAKLSFHKFSALFIPSNFDGVSSLQYLEHMHRHFNSMFYFDNKTPKLTKEACIFLYRQAYIGGTYPERYTGGSLLEYAYKNGMVDLDNSEIFNTKERLFFEFWKRVHKVEGSSNVLSLSCSESGEVDFDQFYHDYPYLKKAYEDKYASVLKNPDVLRFIRENPGYRSLLIDLVDYNLDSSLLNVETLDNVSKFRSLLVELSRYSTDQSLLNVEILKDISINKEDYLQKMQDLRQSNPDYNYFVRNNSDMSYTINPYACVSLKHIKDGDWNRDLLIRIIQAKSEIDFVDEDYYIISYIAENLSDQIERGALFKMLFGEIDEEYPEERYGIILSRNEFMKFLRVNPKYKSILLDLAEFGLDESLINEDVLDEINSNREDYINKIREIRQFYPEYTYKPRKGSKAQYNVDPYLCFNVEDFTQKERWSKEQLNNLVNVMSGYSLTVEDYKILDYIEDNYLKVVSKEELVRSTLQSLDLDHVEVEHVINSINSNNISLSGIHKLLSAVKFSDKRKDAFIRFVVAGNDLLSSDTFIDVIEQNVDILMEISVDRLDEYLKIFVAIDESPSKAIQRMKWPLLNGLIINENPEEKFKMIEHIFVRNNLPDAAKAIIIFRELYTPEYIKGTLRKVSSPWMRQASDRALIWGISNDLLWNRIHSADSNLRRYLETMWDFSTIAERIKNYESDGVDQEFTQQDIKKGALFIQRAEILLGFTGRNIHVEEGGVVDITSLQERIYKIEASFNIKGKSISEKLTRMFFGSLGFNTLEEVLTEMENARKSADARNRRFYSEECIEQDGIRYIVPKSGDFTKGIGEERFFEQIIAIGAGSKEHQPEGLGMAEKQAKIDHDRTPWDTDGNLSGDYVEGISFRDAFVQNLAGDYCSPIGLLFRLDDNKYSVTRTLVSREGVREDISGLRRGAHRYEMFYTGVVGVSHYCIRTGIGSREISTVLVNEEGITEELMEKMKYYIVRSGQYTPIAKVPTGEIIFSPDEYDGMRRAFKGIPVYGGSDITVRRVKTTEQGYGRVMEIKEAIKSDEQRVVQMNQRFRGIVAETLEDLGLTLQGDLDTGLIGERLHNTGSSGRGTNTPAFNGGFGDYDLDTALHLSSEGFDRIDQVIDKLKAKLQPNDDQSHTERHSPYRQIRWFGCRGLLDPDGRPMDIDIGVDKRSTLHEFGSHEAVMTKLNNIWENLLLTYFDENKALDAYYEVLANIVYAKEILKSGHAYKRNEGGFGGIGVENWILAHNGNFIDACNGFWQAAHNGGRRLSFEEFKRGYQLYNAGINLKLVNQERRFQHDNYIANMNESGYNAMLDCIAPFISDDQ